MNASTDSVDLRLNQPLSGSQEAATPSLETGGDGTEEAVAQRETQPAAGDRICWVEVREAPYPPDQQVELLHLQAEAEALLLQLQTLTHRHLSASGGKTD